MSFAKYAGAGGTHKASIPKTPTNRERRIRRWHSVLRIMLTLLAIALTWVILFSQLFDIQTIEVVGNKAIPTTQIEHQTRDLMREKRWGVFPQRNILFFDEQALVTRLRQVRLKNIRAEKKPWGRIILTITERQPVVWVAATSAPTGEWWEVDEVGTILGSTLTPPENAIRVREEESGDIIVGIGSQTVSAAIVQGIIAVKQTVAEPFLAIESFVVKKTEPTSFSALTKDQWQVHFSTELPVRDQVEKLLTFVRQKQKNEPASWRTTIHRVDLRFGASRIYYE